MYFKILQYRILFKPYINAIRLWKPSSDSKYNTGWDNFSNSSPKSSLKKPPNELPVCSMPVQSGGKKYVTSTSEKLHQINFTCSLEATEFFLLSLRRFPANATQSTSRFKQTGKLRVIHNAGQPDRFL